MNDRPVGSPRPGLRIMEMGEDVSVFDPATGQAVALNRTAADVFALADGTTPVAQIAQTLATAYDTTPEAITADVAAAVGSLTEAGVLLPADDS